ncbi:PREDICTED: BSD domain-containing protein 1-like isoform X1 [Camelina sativa]|uniref:BSD domain-containing protein 1-like isoform X1 n=1 Tax=Camelina sativa TaxID=90675 RepID=A0ABM1RGJ3_CAMSA|nr:PREDICTED: BSD domain-containing protein 1-like isoform X2 [Camelina sativa]XP_019098131.1 PREDICTED: BSD domain-containing protein 1-like isoform X1 [Camelina sativa]
MDRFKSVLSEYDHEQQPDEPIASSSSSSWSFGNLIKTLATKSESVIGSYRRDFEEFGSELRKETSIIRQVASRLPDSLEIGASVASESLESVGQAIDDIGASVWKSTARIISHGKESLKKPPQGSDRNLSLPVKPYSRFEMMLLAIQSDQGTFVREPDDLVDFENWSLGFKLEGRRNEIVGLFNENKGVKEIYEEIVPAQVDAETFWRRYFYRVYKLELVEEARVRLVNRAISGEEEEDLSWDLDDDDETSGQTLLNPDSETVFLEEDKVGSRAVSSKDSDISVISTQPSLPEVEDLGWDKMEEDIRSNEGRSLEAGQGSEEKPGWRRRVSVATDEDEDLSWDIEDEDDDSLKQ